MKVMALIETLRDEPYERRLVIVTDRPVFALSWYQRRPASRGVQTVDLPWWFNFASDERIVQRVAKKLDLPVGNYWE